MFVILCSALIAVALFVFWVEPLAFLHALERLTPNVVYRIQTELPLVALSFDDGPHPIFTPQVLEILKQHDAKATFFIIGERAQRYPELVEQIRAARHEAASHYFTNGTCLTHTDAKFIESLEQTERVLRLVDKPLFFRPPGGVARPKQLRLARERGYTCVLGSAYPHDPMHPPVWYIRWLIEKNLAPGTIVILHDGIADPRRSIQALPHVLEAGRRKGLRFVSIGELRELSQKATV